MENKLHNDKKSCNLSYLYWEPVERSRGMGLSIKTCYTVKIQKQLDATQDKTTKKLNIARERTVDSRLMRQTSLICLEALKFCVSVISEEWDTIIGVESKLRKRLIDTLVHRTKTAAPKYPEFDLRFPKMPGYTRRAIIADAFGMVKSYRSNHKNWEETPPMERGAEPKLGIPSRYELTFYDQERKMSCLADGQIGLKLYNGKTWNWYYFQISPSDAKQICRLSKTRKMLSPIVDKVRGRYQIRFTFEEIRELVQDEDKLTYRILAVDLGINAAASWCVMEADGTVHAKGVIHLPCEEDRLNHMINRKRMYQQAGKKSHCAYRWIREANRQLSIQTTKALMYAFDGSGAVDRHSIYHYEHGRKVYNYSLCTFQNEKIYNCDLSAAQNIGARFFLREYQLLGIEGLPATPQRTLCTLRILVSNGLPVAA